jgi:hypothetical protein
LDDMHGEDFRECVTWLRLVSGRGIPWSGYKMRRKDETAGSSVIRIAYLKVPWHVMTRACLAFSMHLVSPPREGGSKG